MLRPSQLKSIKTPTQFAKEKPMKCLIARLACDAQKKEEKQTPGKSNALKKGNRKIVRSKMNSERKCEILEEHM